MDYKVLITTTGIGQRLGDLTKYTNKALVRVGKKPAISYVVEAYHEDTKFVITIGYFGEHVREFLTLAYPERSFEFIEVDKYVGEGSSLGYSMLQAKDVLQCPFIYHASDTIVTESIPVPTENWIGVYKGDDTSQYASWQNMGGGKLRFSDKGATDFDYIHIGLVGINDYKTYWKNLESLYKSNPSDQSLNDCRVLEAMLSHGSSFNLGVFNEWYDIGNTTALYRTRSVIVDYFENLEKLEESIFLFDNFVIKFFYDAKIVEERVARARSLGSLVPKIEGVTKNFYRYAYAQGHTYSDVAVPTNFSEFLTWAKNNLWLKRNEVSETKFKAVCLDFYSEKTKKRIKQFLEENNLKDEKHIINGEAVPAIVDLLNQIDFDWLSNAEQYQFHGDFILDNVVQTENGFCLIDWRHNFGGLLESGDLYYDLAKLNHNLSVNHEIINKNLFSVQLADDNVVDCEILRKNNLVECQQILWNFIVGEGYDLKRVKLLTGIIWLNMAPLHHYPFDQFLYYFGKLHVWQALKEIKYNS